MKIKLYISNGKTKDYVKQEKKKWGKIIEFSFGFSSFDLYNNNVS